jgi:ribosome-associated protein
VRASARAAAIARLTLTKKAYDVAVLDLRGLTTMADFFVVCSADSEPQIKAVADAVEEGMEEAGEAPWHKEAGSPNWVLLDYVDVVLHIFHKDARAFYSLDKLWGDARITAVTDETADLDLEKRAKMAPGMPAEPKPPKKIRVQKAKPAARKAMKTGVKKGGKKGAHMTGSSRKAPGGAGGSQRPRGGPSSPRTRRTP